MPRLDWTTAIGEVGHGVIRVRGYELEDIISRLSFAEACFLTIRGELPDAAQARVLDAALRAILDHGFYAPTTLAARIVASAGPEEIMKGLAAGLLTIGSVTASPQDSAEVITRVEATMIAGKDETAAVDRVAHGMIDRKERMPGIGHPLHPNGDPRARALESIARDNGLLGQKTAYYMGVRKRYLDKIGRDFPVNVDGMLGCVLYELGFTPREMPGLAAISFLPGLIAHCVEEIEQPIALRVADGHYQGPEARPLPT